MTQAIVLILAGISSAAALHVATQELRLRRGDLGAAARKTLECVGIMLIFFAANAALGLLAIIVGRSLTGAFVSTYAMSDVLLVGVSFLQGIFFYCWREANGKVRLRGSRTRRSA
jgi:hypothetical protein